jgi:hypothetical protein
MDLSEGANVSGLEPDVKIGYLMRWPERHAARREAKYLTKSSAAPDTKRVAQRLEAPFWASASRGEALKP